MDKQLKAGDKLRDNDPRMNMNIERIVTVKALFEAYGVSKVLVEDAHGKEISILRKRIYTDHKQRRSGWALIHPKDPAATPTTENGMAPGPTTG